MLLVDLGQGIDDIAGAAGIGALIGKADDAGFFANFHDQDATFKAVGGIVQLCRGEGNGIRRLQAEDDLLGHGPRFDDLDLGVDRILGGPPQFGEQIPLPAPRGLHLQGGKGLKDRFDGEGVECHPEKDRQKDEEKDLPAGHEDVEVIREMDFVRRLGRRRKRGHGHPL